MNKFTNYAFLRNKELYNSRAEAINAMREQMNKNPQDGTMILGRYKDKNGIRTLVGVVFFDGVRKTLSLFKTDGVITEYETNDNNLHYGDLYKEYRNKKTQLENKS